MIANRDRYSPREWILEHMTAEKATAILEARLRDAAERVRRTLDRGSRRQDEHARYAAVLGLRLIARGSTPTIAFSRHSSGRDPTGCSRPHERADRQRRHAGLQRRALRRRSDSEHPRQTYRDFRVHRSSTTDRRPDARDPGAARQGRLPDRHSPTAAQHGISHGTEHRLSSGARTIHREDGRGRRQRPGAI